MEKGAPAETIRKPYEGIRWSDRGELSDRQIGDLQELQSGQPLTRHPWLQELLDQSPEGTRLSGIDVMRALLTRMQELTASEERDLELEAATVEMGFRFSCSSDSDGNPFSFQWVRSNESYEIVITSPEMDFTGLGRKKSMLPSDIVGIGHIYATYNLGGSIGYSGKNASRWFVSYRAERISVDIPFDSITEVVDEKGHGSVIESPSDRSGPFHEWIQREAA